MRSFRSNRPKPYMLEQQSRRDLNHSTCDGPTAPTLLEVPDSLGVPKPSLARNSCLPQVPSKSETWQHRLVETRFEQRPAAAAFLGCRKNIWQRVFEAPNSCFLRSRSGLPEFEIQDRMQYNSLNCSDFTVRARTPAHVQIELKQTTASSNAMSAKSSSLPCL